MKKIKWRSREGTVLLDALNNCTFGETRDPEAVVYGRGILVGIMSALMLAGYNFDDAWYQILDVTVDKYAGIHWNEHPGHLNPACIPQGWPTLDDYKSQDKQPVNGAAMITCRYKR